LSLYKNLFKQTALYGLATVLPRMLTFLLNPLYVKMLPKGEFGEVSIIFAYLVFLNVALSYGMETAFFRFYNTESDKKKVIATATISILCSSLAFLVIALLFRDTLGHWTNIDSQYISYMIWILVLDALSVIPFSKLRANSRPMFYAAIKIGNVVLNVCLNVFFLLALPKLASGSGSSFWNVFYIEHFQIGYIFISGLCASMATFIVLSPDYFQIKGAFDADLWKKMMGYAFPILIAGIAFAINEHFDKILLEKMHISKADIGAYSACYKLGLFMVLFRTAYTLGIEPFFFSHASNENAPQTYAMITKYFVIFGSFICLFVIVFADLLKEILVPNASYWDAMNIVPLIVLANFFLGIYTNLSVWYKLTDKTSVGAYISLVGAAVTLLLNFILIPYISYTGSAIATIAAYGAMMIISYQMGKQKYPIPYDFPKIFSYLGLTIVLSAFSFYTPHFQYLPDIRNNYPIKIIILLLFLYFIYRNEKETLLRIAKRK
jgi:O-antigen/teichoic acid export membrane protein